MAKKMCNLNLEETTIDELDSLAAKMNLSRSKTADLLLAGVLGQTSVTSLYKTMFGALMPEKKRRGEELYPDFG